MSRLVMWSRVVVVLAAMVLDVSAVKAESPAVRAVRNLSAASGGITSPEGVAWLPGSERFVVMQAGAAEVRIGLLEALGDPAGTLSLAARRVRPENVAFDAKRSRLVMLDDVSSELIVADVTADGTIDAASVVRRAAPPLGPVRAAGIAIDASSGTLYVLDRLSRRIAVVPEELWNGGADSGERTRWIDLDAIDAADLRGLGWDPAGQRWFVLDARTATLIAVNASGEAAGRWELDASELPAPRGIAVAPSGDPTDDPARISVYVANATTTKQAGSVVEFKFRTELPLQVAATVSATLVRTINTAQWSPPSPDPMGIAYDKVQNRLLVSDSEVDEMSLYSGANFYECSLTGTLLRSSNLLRFTHEPAGVAFDTPSRLFISDDSAHKVFLLNVGGDGHAGGSDDTWTSFSATAIGDAEGITFDKTGNRLFTSDGLGEEIYQIRAGSDGKLGTSDDQITHFDTSVLGITDPETVEYNPSGGTLYIIGKNDKLVETTVTGSLLNTISMSGISARAPSGMCLGPNSTNSNLSSLYICDRGIDNDSTPKENDGRIFEITASILGSNPGGGGGGSDPSPAGDGNFPIAVGSDDAEQGGSSVSPNGSDLELVTDGSTVQTVGLRFSGVAIPKNAVISNAWIQLTADESQSETTTLRIEGQAADNPLTFTSASSNISSRPRTTQFVSWTPAAWGSGDGAGANQKTPSLTTIVQALVNRSGWASGNAMAFILTGTGHRTAVSYEGDAGKAAILHIDVLVPNVKPSVSAGPDHAATVLVSTLLEGTVSDDGLPTPGTLTRLWTKQSGPGTVTFLTPSSTSTLATFSVAGTYVLRLTASDGEFTEFDEVQVVASLAPSGGGGGSGTAFAVKAGSDDAEQNGSSVELASADLELVLDGSTHQTVGLRFTGITVPRNAVIANAWIQFHADEAQSVATALRIEGQAVDNPPTFTTASSNISSRPRTTQFVNWTPAAWGSADGAGANQRTASLTAIVQALVNRSGWASGNAMAFIITGTGHRTADSFEGGTSKAPVLHIVLSAGTPTTVNRP